MAVFTELQKKMLDSAIDAIGKATEATDITEWLYYSDHALRLIRSVSDEVRNIQEKHETGR